ncbi:MAG: flippase-like domain-containing protein [Candidatus Aenigmarchaeota archaeon]|nr:flippase-like domain-containing protein [Candidatus Aenigmarchaeota archaeon]
MRMSRLLPFLGILLFLLIVINLDIVKMLDLISRIRADYVVISLALLVPVLLLRGEKWRLIIKSYGIEYGLISSTKAWISGFFVGIVTPGRIGDLSRAYYLKKDKGVTIGKSLTTVVVERIIDVVTLFVLACAGLVLIASSYIEAGEMLLYVSVLFMAFIAVVFMMARKGFARSVMRPLYVRFMPVKYRTLIGRVFNDFYSGMGQISRYRMATAFLTVLVAWSIMILQYQFMAMALGLDLTYLFLLAIVPILALLDIIPVTFSGIGTRDAALIFFLSLVSVSAESAVSYSLLILFVNYISVGFAGLLLWIRDPIKIRPYLEQDNGNHG